MLRFFSNRARGLPLEACPGPYQLSVGTEVSASFGPSHCDEVKFKDGGPTSLSLSINPKSVGFYIFCLSSLAKIAVKS